MHFLDSGPGFLRDRETMVDEDSPDHENTVLRFDFPAHLACECALACSDVPRCQRGGKCAL